MPAHIVVIEDDPASLELATYLLIAAGHSVMSASHGVEGIRIAVEHKPDLIICDMQLPDLNGFEVRRHLAARPDWRVVPIVAVTALSMPGDRELALIAGFNGYLTKPISPETFLQEIDAFLPAELRSDKA